MFISNSQKTFSQIWLLRVENMKLCFKDNIQNEQNSWQVHLFSLCLIIQSHFVIILTSIVGVCEQRRWKEKEGVFFSARKHLTCYNSLKKAVMSRLRGLCLILLCGLHCGASSSPQGFQVAVSGVINASQKQIKLSLSQQHWKLYESHPDTLLPPYPTPPTCDLQLSFSICFAWRLNSVPKHTMLLTIPANGAAEQVWACYC